MTQANLPPESEIEALVGHQFPGGRYTIAHWENFLLTECTGAKPLDDDYAHPVALFHMPILGANTSIAEMFALGQADHDASIGIESYEWEFHQPLREEIEYRVAAEITSAARHVEPDRTYDRIQFRFDLFDASDVAVATTIVTWHYRRAAA